MLVSQLTQTSNILELFPLSFSERMKLNFHGATKEIILDGYTLKHQVSSQNFVLLYLWYLRVAALNTGNNK